ncbi:MAG TPA: D-alanine--D-alanine ligase [Bacteroidales bacterium]|nr:D-alanine--D-alanine ligase [Bacteroidales bacterium]HOL98941.1 D-alanine--D-alanine ligase [Bacteroidales bacterium]HOM36876.1 D-alanine--D-alanine ligase [Bacteroidales bacterium]HUM33364.1 D-alanine--D-alanine ligase [Bacteroidales bacterium]
MKKNIAVLAGGYTSERNISLNSGKQVFNSIDRNKYNVYFVDVSRQGLLCEINPAQFAHIDMNDFSVMHNGEKIRFDFAFIVLHGSPGEDGKIQAWLDILQIPYSACGVFASVNTLHKAACKRLLSNTDVKIPKYVILNNPEAFNIEEILDITGLPCFVKPNNAGSSFGVSKVYKKEDLIEAVNIAMQEDNIVIIEEFIKGTEVSCGVIKTKSEEIVLPVTEIVPKKDFFDTEAKYDPTLTDEITPARISEEETLAVQSYASFIYDFIGCKGIVRIDFIIRDGIPYFLEVNSIPGMSSESIVPKQIRSIGKNIADILTMIIEDNF